MGLASPLTQGLKVGDIFSFDEKGKLRTTAVPLEARLRPLAHLACSVSSPDHSSQSGAQVPVRAIVLPLTDPMVSRRLNEATHRHLRPYKTVSIFYQNASIYHMTLHHTSTRDEPRPLKSKWEEVEEIRKAGQAIVGRCPVRAVLDRRGKHRASDPTLYWQRASASLQGRGHGGRGRGGAVSSRSRGV